MTDDQLREIKEWHENDGELHQFQVDKLIEVAERFYTIQKENAKLSIMLRDTQSDLWDAQKQNKRYREVIESMTSEIKYALYSNKSKDVKEHYLKNAERYGNEAMEGESNE